MPRIWGDTPSVMLRRGYCLVPGGDTPVPSMILRKGDPQYQRKQEHPSAQCHVWNGGTSCCPEWGGGQTPQCPLYCSGRGNPHYPEQWDPMHSAWGDAQVGADTPGTHNRGDRPSIVVGKGDPLVPGI